jgi:hypothetical protein
MSYCPGLQWTAIRLCDNESLVGQTTYAWRERAVNRGNGSAAATCSLLDGRLFIRHFDRIYITSTDVPHLGSQGLPATARAKARGRSR